VVAGFPACLPDQRAGWKACYHQGKCPNCVTPKHIDTTRPPCYAALLYCRYAVNRLSPNRRPSTVPQRSVRGGRAELTAMHVSDIGSIVPQRVLGVRTARHLHEVFVGEPGMPADNNGNGRAAVAGPIRRWYTRVRIAARREIAPCRFTCPRPARRISRTQWSVGLAGAASVRGREEGSA